MLPLGNTLQQAGHLEGTQCSGLVTAMEHNRGALSPLGNAMQCLCHNQEIQCSGLVIITKYNVVTQQPLGNTVSWYNYHKVIQCYGVVINRKQNVVVQSSLGNTTQWIGYHYETQYIGPRHYEGSQCNAQITIRKCNVVTQLPLLTQCKFPIINREHKIMVNSPFANTV